MYLKVNYILPNSKANGPGSQFTIWTQGCSIHYPQCSNKDTWDPLGGEVKDTWTLMGEILKTAGINGITITGGEPLDQYLPIYSLIKDIKNLRGLSIFLTTGYPMNVVKKRFNKILGYLDIICTGPFEYKQICSGEWKGSSNQEIAFLTELGREQSKWPIVSKEIFIGSEGHSWETGFSA